GIGLIVEGEKAPGGTRPELVRPVMRVGEVPRKERQRLELAVGIERGVVAAAAGIGDVGADTATVIHLDRSVITLASGDDDVAGDRQTPAEYLLAHTRALVLVADVAHHRARLHVTPGTLEAGRDDRIRQDASLPRDTRGKIRAWSLEGHADPGHSFVRSG